MPAESDVRRGIAEQANAEREMEQRAGQRPKSQEQKERELARLIEMNERKKRDRR